jgi:hypothetical protein
VEISYKDGSGELIARIRRHGRGVLMCGETEVKYIRIKTAELPRRSDYSEEAIVRIIARSDQSAEAIARRDTGHPKLEFGVFCP